MSSSAAQAYARVANTTATPREIEAQALLMAANKLQDISNNANATIEQTTKALMFNRQLWTVFLGEALNQESQQPVDVRQKIVDISMFVLTHTLALQAIPAIKPDELKPLIDINRNIAAGLSGRG